MLSCINRSLSQKQTEWPCYVHAVYRHLSYMYKPTGLAIFKRRSHKGSHAKQLPDKKQFGKSYSVFMIILF